jgi:hypothetical protein
MERKTRFGYERCAIPVSSCTVTSSAWASISSSCSAGCICPFSRRRTRAKLTPMISASREHTYGPLRAGQVIFVGTDGVWEMPDAKGEAFGKTGCGRSFWSQLPLK